MTECDTKPMPITTGLRNAVQTDIITALDTSSEWERMPGKQRTREFGSTTCWRPVRR